MKDTFIRITTIGAILCAAACGAQKSKTGPTLDGNATLSAPKINALTAGQVEGKDICATFTIQPYQFNASGVPQNAGGVATFSTSESSDGTQPVFNAADGASAPAEVLGCASDGPTSGSYNWGYFVTANSFTTCVAGEGGTGADSLAAALAAIQPVILNEPIACNTSGDVPLSITIPISIPLTLQAGYIDVTASIDVTDIYVGCKMGDPLSDGLHFGQTYSAPTSGAPTSIGTLTFLSNNNTGAADSDALTNVGWVDQFSGSFTDSASSTTQFYSTGIAPSDTSLVYQGFVSSAEAACINQMYGQPGNTLGYEGLSPWWFATKSAECIYNSASSPADTADLADAVVLEDDAFWGHLFAAATLRSGSGGQYVDIVSGNDNPTNIFQASTTDAQIGGSATSPSLANPNIGEHPITIPSAYLANGVYPNLTGFGGGTESASFWVTALDISTQQLVFTGVDANGLGTWTPVPDAATSACLGLFSTGNSCSAPLVYGIGAGTGICGYPQAATVWAP